MCCGLFPVGLKENPCILLSGARDQGEVCLAPLVVECDSPKASFNASSDLRAYLKMCPGYHLLNGEGGPGVMATHLLCPVVLEDPSAGVALSGSLQERLPRGREGPALSIGSSNSRYYVCLYTSARGQVWFSSKG